MASKEFIDKEGFKQRKYETYDAYVDHQKSKLDNVGNIHEWLKKYDVVFREVLNGRLKETQIDFKGKSVLCLAARIGTEVKSFFDQGAFAVGMDLNPGKESKYVVHGDFHNIQFPNDSVDFVFTNSFDHSIKPEKLISEILRVLKKDGSLIMDIAGTPPGSYECLDWKSIDDVINFFLSKGFTISRRMKFERGNGMLWHGEQVIFKKKGV